MTKELKCCSNCANNHITVDMEPCLSCDGKSGYSAKKETKADMVNHPPHYERKGALECIDELELILTPEEFIGFLKGNIHKYRYRANLKGGEEDMKKSDWYANKLAEYLTKKDLQAKGIRLR